MTIADFLARFDEAERAELVRDIRARHAALGAAVRCLEGDGPAREAADLPAYLADVARRLGRVTELLERKA